MRLWIGATSLFGGPVVIVKVCIVSPASGSSPAFPQAGKHHRAWLDANCGAERLNDYASRPTWYRTHRPAALRCRREARASTRSAVALTGSCAKWGYRSRTLLDVAPDVARFQSQPCIRLVAWRKVLEFLVPAVRIELTTYRKERSRPGRSFVGMRSSARWASRSLLPSYEERRRLLNAAGAGRISEA